MLDACVLTIARDADDYLYPCISVIAPHVRRVRLTIDRRSKDGTIDVAYRLQRQFPNVEVQIFKVENPLVDLVRMRNSQLGFPEKWGFVIDSDEYHHEIASYALPEGPAYALQCWAVWTSTLAHRSSSRARIGRIFRNAPDVEWRGVFGKEALYTHKGKIFQDATPLLPHRYIHFTHLKKSAWRQEMGQIRIADGKHLQRMPDPIITKVNEIHAQMPYVRYREI